MTASACDICSDLKPVYRCSDCGQQACRDHYGKRDALCTVCLAKRGETNHPRSILHPIFH